MSIVVFGSLNMDIVNRVDKLPLPGETIQARSTQYYCGGKGGNQATAVSKSGSSVVMIGAVGEDDFGSILLQRMELCGISTEYIFRKKVTTGTAFITINQAGENQIILSPGANYLWTIEDVQRSLSEDVLTGIEYALLQNEVPWELNRSLIHWLHESEVKIVYNPAPASPIASEIFPLVHTLVLNETEAQTITGLSTQNEQEVRTCAKQLIGLGVNEVIVTLGEKGSLYYNRDGLDIFTKAYRVKTVDTTAAGDTFIGAFVAARSRKNSLEKSLQFAAAASAITVSRHGAQDSIPTEKEINEFISNY
jgi:ribokinase